jgi:hypothetical protein
MQIAIEAGANPFAILSFIVAPAILTNASSVLAMSTSNRLARAVDRARELSRQLEDPDAGRQPQTERRLRELESSELRALMLIRALQAFYTALGAFASATLLSLAGAVLVSMGSEGWVPAFEIIAVVTGLVAVGSLVQGSVLLVRETRIAVQTLRDTAAGVRELIASGRPVD